MSVRAEEAIPALRPPRDELRPSFWGEHGWLLVVAAVVVLGAVALWMKWLRRPKPAAVIAPEVLARSSLEGLCGRPEDTALVAEVSRILRHYVIAAFSLPPDELTIAELGKALQFHAQASADLVGALTNFLRRCDEQKFAPVPAASPLGAVAGALELVEKTEAHRKQAARALSGSVATMPPSAR